MNRRIAIALAAVAAAGVAVAGIIVAVRTDVAPKAAMTVAADVLLSQRKPVTTTSSVPCCQSQDAVDGDPATRWTSDVGVGPQWIDVDLGSRYRISRVRLLWGVACAATYQVETSTDKVTWTTIASTASGDGGIDDLTVRGAGRYVRTVVIKPCGPNPSSGYTVKEFEVYGGVDARPPGTTPPPTTPMDSIAPGAPTAVRAGLVTSACVSLSWTAATDNVAVTGYTIFAGGAQVGSSRITSAQICDLKPSTRYQFTVRAGDANQVGPASNPPLAVTTARACTQPVCEASQIAQDKDVPWGLVGLPDGTILYNRKDAHDIIRLDPVTGQKTTVGVVPGVSGAGGEGGLLGLAVAPTFDKDRWLYIFYTSSLDNRIARIKMTTANQLDLKSLRTLVVGIPRNKLHNGGSLRWGPDDKLYAGTGDGGDATLAQSTESLGGKVLRINPDGGVPKDNPYSNHVWSLGHSNVQGLAFDSQGRLWEQESGNGTADELNLVEKAGNYGWPNCQGATARSRANCGPGFVAPKRTWPVAQCTCAGIAIVNDVIYVAAQRGSRLWRLDISGAGVKNPQSFFWGRYGRLRGVEPTPDGGLWMTTGSEGDLDDKPNNSSNKIFRVELNARPA